MMMMTAGTAAVPLSLKPQSVGEELYLVHLSRDQSHEPEENDFDHTFPIHHNRQMSPGEELYLVHLRRLAQSILPDDEDKEETDISSRIKSTAAIRTSSKKKALIPHKASRSSPRIHKKVLSLRNRQIAMA